MAKSRKEQLLDYIEELRDGSYEKSETLDVLDPYERQLEDQEEAIRDTLDLLEKRIEKVFK